MSEAAVPHPLNSEALIEWIKPVQDPELHMGLVDLGLVYGIEVKEEGKIKCTMTLTSPACPAGDQIVKEIMDRLLEYPGVQEANVDIVFEPRWDPKTMASEEAKETLGIW